MVSLRPRPFWCAFRLCRHNVCVRTSNNYTILWLRFWLDEHHWCDDSGAISLFPTVVREFIWPSTRKLLNERIACWLRTNRCTPWHRPLHLCIHCLAHGVWCLSFTTRSGFHTRGTVHEPLLPQADSTVCNLCPLAVVGNHVSVASLCC